MEARAIFLVCFLVFVEHFTPSECKGHRRKFIRTTALPSLDAGSITAVNFTNLGKQKCNGKPLVLNGYGAGAVRSPGYSRRYKGNLDCLWKIVVPNGFNIRIRFRPPFHIEDSSGCSRDYLMLSNSNRFRNPLTFCGKRRPRSLVIPNNKVWIRFHSDARGTGRGFQLSYRAEDVNECRRDVCTFPSLCRNTHGGYACDCQDGYEKKGRRESGTCEDIDECKSGDAKCEHQCVNTDGSFYCVCLKGFRAGPDGKCRDRNECGRQNGGCSHFCRNFRGTYRCGCPPGHSLHIDHKTCYPEIVFRRSQYTANVKENSPIGTSVITVTASTQSKAKEIFYSITTENLDLPSKFTINPTQGIVSVKGQLDREKCSTYLLEVKAVAKDSLNKVQTTRTFVSVNVMDENDNVPRFEYVTYYLKVPCNATVGRSIYKVKAVDLDAGYNGRIKYKFSTETPYFSILPNSGRIKVTKSLRRFCHQRRRNYPITRKIIARDQGKHSQSSHTWIQFVIGPPSRLTKKYPDINTKFQVAAPKTIVHRHIGNVNRPLAQHRNLTGINVHENKQ